MSAESPKTLKTIGIGTEYFHTMIDNNRYYVDKTPFIKTIFKDRGAVVTLITRPRRFGKTLTMSTFYDFLSMNPEDPDDLSRQEKWFRDTEICRNEEYRDFRDEFMGKFPVIFISLKSVDSSCFDDACCQMGSVIFGAYNTFSYLADSHKLNKAEKKIFNAIAGDKKYICRPENKIQLEDSLTDLVKFLYKHHGVKPVLLIDEYDVPLANAASHGYYDDMAEIIGSLLGNVLKTNDCLGRAVLTGCLQAGMESIFTGLNNFETCSVLKTGNREISKGIGFTSEETQTVLEYYGLADYWEDVRDNYDGYNFGTVRMFCPWDVMLYCDDNQGKLKDNPDLVYADNYWLNTSGNDVVEEFMGFIKPDDVDKMQKLLDGEAIISPISPKLCCGDLKNHNITDFWTLLLYTGYLTFDPHWKSPEEITFEQQARKKEPASKDAKTKKEKTEKKYLLSIPNMEIRECFERKIKSFFENSPLMKDHAELLIKGLLSGDAQSVQNSLEILLSRYVSVRDFAIKAPGENYYHGFVNGLLANGVEYLGEHRSNMETGDGYVDIVAASRKGDTVVILELKKTDIALGARVKSASDALEQIRNKRYAEKFMDDLLVQSIYAYGICFYKKNCAVMVDKLK